MDNFESEGTEEYFDDEQEQHLEEKLIEKIAFKNYMGNEFANIDLDSNHPENAFSNFKYYKAMKAVPLKQKKTLYLLEVVGLSVGQVAKILNVKPEEVNNLKDLAIKNFKQNLKGEG